MKKPSDLPVDKKSIQDTGSIDMHKLSEMWVFPKIGIPQKWMVSNGKPYYLMDDLGGKTPYFRKHPSIHPYIHN